jgi:hypothetical protein
MSATASPKRLRISGQGGLAAAILGPVVQQGCYGLGLAAAVFQHHAADRHQMGNIGNIRALAGLAFVEFRRIGQGVDELP